MAMADEERLVPEGHLRSFMQDWKTLEGLISGIVAGQGVAEAGVYKKAQAIIYKYQEEGQLLEAHLEAIIPALLHLVRQHKGEEEEEALAVIRHLCSIVHALMTVCGYKTVVKFFPHQAADVEFTVALLHTFLQDAQVGSSLKEESNGFWETQCTLLLWLSILVLVPFDLASVDTSLADCAAAGDKKESPLVQKMVGMCQHFLSSPGPSRELAGVVLARLLTRPDMTLPVRDFITWSEQALQQRATDVFLVTGVTGALVAIFKVGGRDMLLPLAAATWSQARSLAVSPVTKQSALLRKLLVKLVQRIGLTYLLPRLAAWRYLRGHRSLPVSFAAAGVVVVVEKEEVVQEEQETEMEVPDEIEEVMEELLAGLRDKDTVVRWCAAKGIGRVTARLSLQLADEVVASVVELFRGVEGDGAWHGGCLALAELARRGLLLPGRLPTVVPVIVKALHYDVRRGPHSVGCHVRDAAAYVCWAFARAYSADFMLEPLQVLAPALLSVACYDREVNCRRAAAAAFQECVGRQPKFAHAIDLVNAADFFSLGSRSHAYRSVAVFVAQFSEYRIALIEELLYTKIQHWEKGLRELAAQSLALLVAYDPVYFGGPVLDALLSWILSPDLTLRHGAALTTAEVVRALHQSGGGFCLPPAKQKMVVEIVPAIEKARLYRGKGGEMMRGAVCRLMECVCEVQLPLSGKLRKMYHDSIDENLRHPNAGIQDSAVAALKAFELVHDDDGGCAAVKKYLQVLKADPNAAARRGAALAFSALPARMLLPAWEDVLTALCWAVLDRSQDGDAETRVNAVRGLSEVCHTLVDGGGGKDVIQAVRSQVMDALVDALDDYAVDNRGDVGSWVREAAMEALERCSYLVCGQSMQHGGFDAALATRVVNGLAKQAVEKIDRVRDVAGKTLQRMLLHPDTVPSIPHGPHLAKCVAEEQQLNWAAPGDSFPRMVQFLRFSEYRHSLLSGLVISIGGLAESLAKCSLQALLHLLHSSSTLEDWDHLRPKPPAAASASFNKAHVQWLSVELGQVLNTYAGNDRVIVPAFKTMDILFSKRVFTELQECDHKLLSVMLCSIVKEIQGSKDVAKLLLAINLFTHLALMQLEPVSSDALAELLSLLGHRYPKVRKVCAEQVYLLFLQLGDHFNTDSVEVALELISETCWDGPIEAVKDERNKLLHLFKLQQQQQQQILSHNP